MKYNFIFIYLFFTTLSFAQNLSFLKIIDNEEYGYEFVGDIFEKNDSIYLFSNGRISNQSGGIIKLKVIDKNHGEITEDFIDERINNDSYAINSSVTKNNKYYHTGFHKTAPSVAANNYFLFGYANGKKIFNVVLGEENISDISRGITIDNEDNIIICGHVWKENSEFDYNAFVSKHDTLGNTIWHTVIPAKYSNLIPHSVTTDNKNNIYAMANEDGFGLGIRHVTLIKLNPHGDTLWTKSYEGGSGVASNILFNKRGNLIASVTADFNGAGRGFTLMELDTSGTVLWTKSYNQHLNYNAFSNDIIELKNGGYAVALNIGYPVLLTFDENGNVLKTKHFDNIEFTSVERILELDDGSFVIAGNITEFNVDIPKVMWLLKTDDNGDFISSNVETLFPDFEIHPNPTNGSIFAKNIEYDKVWVINTIGQLVKSFGANENINLREIPSGNYFLYFESNKGTVVKQIIKQQ